ncbi:MAG: hypothetical protein IT580_01970 [Verrucomicrobiales bacterium]|nr:hypothetical protein [Verrucomicrobiales bacterium]
MKSSLSRLAVGPALLASGWMMSVAAPWQVTVSSTADTGTGSLRAAIEAVNSQDEEGEIDLTAVTGVIALQSRLPEVQRSVRLVGPSGSSGRLLVSGEGQWPILAFAAGTTSEVLRLVLTNGLATGYRHGAAISNAATLRLQDCEISGNLNRHGWGGGIYNRHELTLQSCLLRSNLALGEPGGDADFQMAPYQGVGPGGGAAGLGGAIFQDSGRLVARDSVFEGNRATGGKGGDFLMDVGGTARGGGPTGGERAQVGVPAGHGGFGSGGGGLRVYEPYSGGTGGFGGGHSRSPAVATEDAYYGGGTAGGFDLHGAGAGAALGGAVFARSGSVSLVGCSFRGNRVIGGDGGGGFPSMTGERGGEGGAGSGAAVFSLAAVVQIEGSEFLENAATGGKGGASGGDWTSAGGLAEGGAVFLMGGSVRLETSRISSNRVEGGVGSSGKNGGVSASGRGAAIALRAGELLVSQSLIQGNEAWGGVAGSGFRFPGVPGSGYGGGVFARRGELELVNSTLSGNRVLGSDGYGANLGFPNGPVGASEGAGLALLSESEGFRYPYLIPEDLRDPAGFARRLAAGSDPVARLFQAAMGSNIVARLLAWNGAEPSAQAKSFMIEGCNQFVLETFATPSQRFWNAERFAGVTLREETQSLLASNPEGTPRERLNRMLLEDYFPTDLVRMPSVILTAPVARLRFSTITSNHAVQARLVQFMFPAMTNGPVDGGGIYNEGGRLSLEGVLSAGNRSATNADIGGTFESVLPNLIGSLGTAVGSQAHDLVGVDPQLGPLQDNGGPTWTHALPAGSPAVDVIARADSVSNDQRGARRPAGVGWDLGAVESGPMPVVGPRIVRVGRSASGGIELVVEGLLGGDCRLEFSPDLSTWTRVETVVEGEVVGRSLEGASGYYRVVCGE